MNLATTLHFDPEWKLVSLAVSKVDLINTHRLREIGVLSLAYSAIALLEGTGLLLEKTWAEYLTLGLTVAFLPWELFELAKDPGVALGLGCCWRTWRCSGICSGCCGGRRLQLREK